MAETRRLVNLPGYDDTARDIYETPELTDDTATTLTQPASPRSPSESSNTSDEDDGDDHESYGVSRRRLYPERARSRFAAVQTGGHVDLSDRVDGRRRGYRVRKRVEEGEEEGLEARIARLRREIEECRVEAESELDFGGRDETAVTELGGLSSVLAGIGGPNHRRTAKGSIGVVDGDARRTAPGAEVNDDGGASEEQVLKRVTDFDARLSALEQALGTSALDSATIDTTSTPVLPTLALLDQQLATLTAAGSLTSLETASARIQKLRAEAEELSQSQTQSRPSTSGSDGGTSQPSSLAPDDVTKLHSLYQLLPTLQSLSPTVPALLTRLWSLRTLHAKAASAAGELDEVERRQQEMDAELKAWKEGLEKVEAAIADAREANGTNGKFVEKWVKDLEGRLKGLGR